MSPRYIDDSIIGEGGFGQVCTCTDRVTNRQYAKKTLLPGATPDEVARFSREVKILSRLNNDSIVRILDSHTSNSPYYFIMPLYRVSLDKELRNISLQQNRIAPIFNRIISGVGHAHEHGIIHRDLKPQNVLLNTDEDVVVSDFGLGRQLDAETTRKTMTGEKMGSLLYSAPEQFDDAKDADIRADIYSLGVMLLALHAGPISYINHNHSKIPATLRPVVKRATQPERSERYATVTEMRTAWIAASGQLNTVSVFDQMTALVDHIKLSRGDLPGYVDRLHDLLISSQDDKYAIYDIVMKFTPAISRLMESRWPDDFYLIIKAFCDASLDPRRSHNFGYVDTIANQCQSIYEVSQNAEIRSEIISCYISLAFGYNRFSLMDNAPVILQQPKLQGEGVFIVERIKHNSQKWIDSMRKNLSATRLDYHLRQFFFPENPADVI